MEAANWSHNVNRVTIPAWKKIWGNDLEGAKSMVQELRGSIQNTACGPQRELLDLMEFLIDRKMNRPGSLADYPSLKVQLPGVEEVERPHIAVVGEGRAFTVIPVRPMNTPMNDETGVFRKAFENLGVQLASLRSEDELRQALQYAFSKMLTGGQRTRKSAAWEWVDGSPWNFHDFAPGEEEKPIKEYTRWQSLVLMKNQKAIANVEFANVDRMLIQFPAAWLEEGGEREGL